MLRDIFPWRPAASRAAAVSMPIALLRPTLRAPIFIGHLFWTDRSSIIDRVSNLLATMPRCREFDIDQVLDQALNAFWLKGYAATSMADLLAAMQLSKSSFYECFGSKRAVLLAALQRYSTRGTTEIRDHFGAPGPVAPLLATWLRQSIDPATHRPGERCGCLIINIAVELAPHDAEIETAVRGYLDALAAFLAEIVARGRADGSMAANLDPVAAGDRLLNLIAGLQVLAKGGIEPARLAAVVDAHLDSLLPPN